MRYIQTDRSPTPAGHYSQAVVYGGVVYVSGQLPIDPANPDAEPGSTEAQTRQTLQNVAGVLEASGSSLSHILQLMIFVSDGGDWGTVNRVVAEMLGDHKPSRAVVPVAPLKRGFALEITAIAALAEPAEHGG